MELGSKLLHAFKNDIGLTDHQIASFNNFIDIRLQKLISEEDIHEIKLESSETSDFVLKFNNVIVSEPSIKEADGAVRKIIPMEARVRNLTYSSSVLLEVVPVINGIEQEPQVIKIGEIPIMVKSSYCALHGKTREELIEMGEDPDDPGGYFIINGTERIIVMMEEIVENRPIIEKKKGAISVRINSELNGFIQRHIIENAGKIMTISFANVKKLPVIVLLKALGLETDKEIFDAIGEAPGIEDLYFDFYESGVKSKKEAYDFIANKLHIVQKEYRTKRIDEILRKYLLPHLGDNKKEKAFYLCKIIRKLLIIDQEGVESQDIDHFKYKRIKLVGDFMELLFRSVFVGRYGLIARIMYQYQKLSKRGKMPSIESIIESSYLSKRIISHMATGQWIGGRTGVCQRLERTNFMRFIAHLRNVISPLSSTQEHFEARALHPTQWGRLCAEETPEGMNIGFRKYMASSARISRVLRKDQLKQLNRLLKGEKEGPYPIFLDGKFIGATKDQYSLINKIKEKRRSGLITSNINLGFDPLLNEININTDSGRFQRPVVVVENGKSKLTSDYKEKVLNNEITWMELVNQGIIEYLDAEEEDDSLIAVDENDITQETTHLEIDPKIILGVSALLVPFPEHNRGDRVNFGAKMAGQSLGLYLTNFNIRTDTKADILLYPQLPLVKTIGEELMDLKRHPQGQNVIVAVMSFYGYNIEDGLIINKRSIERGFGRSTFFRDYSSEEKQYWGIEKDEIRVPDKAVSGYKTEELYENLAEDGIINRETKVKSGDVLIGKISPLRFFGPTENLIMEIENRRETSETVSYGEEGVVDNVLITETSDGNKFVKIRLRDYRIPELGDKFASRHGQKGVLSLIVPEEDMPFTKDGITPDIIVNPHAIPSRMTVGQLLEIIQGKLGAVIGKRMDASAFSQDATEKNIRNALEETGFDNAGKEALYSGSSGKRLESEILIGPVYYQKLHHMVANKLQSRSRGPVTLLTKQPTAGRSKQGGLRLGEMEKDCLVAHGASLLLKERFDSDRYDVPICTKCGSVAVYDFLKGRSWCPVCKKSKVKNVEMSYAFKLMTDELKSLCINPRFLVEED